MDDQQVQRLFDDITTRVSKFVGASIEKRARYLLGLNLDPTWVGIKGWESLTPPEYARMVVNQYVKREMLALEGPALKYLIQSGKIADKTIRSWSD